MVLELVFTRDSRMLRAS